jgi:hypothetical protein
VAKRHTNWDEYLKEKRHCETKLTSNLKLPHIEKYLVVSNNGSVSQMRNLKSIFKDYDSASRAGQLIDSKIKTNQDSLIIETKLASNGYLFGVADGHGQFGDKVSKFIKDTFPRKV